MVSWVQFGKRILGNERGMAVLITVMVASLLAAITLHFGLIVRQEIIASTHAKNRTYLESVATSGVHLGMAALEKDGIENDFDSKLDRWGKMSEANLGSLFSGGSLEVDISDLSGKLQINSLPENEKSREILMRLLEKEQLGLESEDARNLVDALSDWVDDDDDEREYGAEDSYYYGLNPAYATRNGPIEHIDELLMVKGMTPEVFFGSGGKEGLSQYITAHGTDGKINIATADQLLLEAMNPEITPDFAKMMIEYREDPANADRMGEPEWYKKHPDWPGHIEIEPELIKVKSTFFRIAAKGELNSLKKTVEVIVERNDNHEIILLSKIVERNDNHEITLLSKKVN
jgi:general secretion pathway protein K